MYIDQFSKLLMPGKRERLEPLDLIPIPFAFFTRTLHAFYAVRHCMYIFKEKT